MDRISESLFKTKFNVIYFVVEGHLEIQYIFSNKQSVM